MFIFSVRLNADLHRLTMKKIIIYIAGHNGMVGSALVRLLTKKTRKYYYCRSKLS